MKRLFVIVLVALLLAGCMPKVEDCMAIEFNGSNQSIEYDKIGLFNATDLNTMTICAWIYPDTVKEQPRFSGFLRVANYTDEQVFINNVFQLMLYKDPALSLTRALYFTNPSATTVGRWYTGNEVTLSAWNHVCLTYDRGSVDNDPIIYVNGAPVSLTESAQPSGISVLNSLDWLTIGRINSLDFFDGKICDVRFYKTIKSESDILNIYETRILRNIMADEDLIFWMPALGASGISSYDGATLSESNKILDHITGVWGTPINNPTGRGDVKYRIY